VREIPSGFAGEQGADLVGLKTSLIIFVIEMEKMKKKKTKGISAED
jgi:hypothetical protein